MEKVTNYTAEVILQRGEILPNLLVKDYRPRYSDEMTYIGFHNVYNPKKKLRPANIFINVSNTDDLKSSMIRSLLQEATNVNRDIRFSDKNSIKIPCIITKRLSEGKPNYSAGLLVPPISLGFGEEFVMPSLYVPDLVLDTVLKKGGINLGYIMKSEYSGLEFYFPPSFEVHEDRAYIATVKSSDKGGKQRFNALCDADFKYVEMNSLMHQENKKKLEEIINGAKDSKYWWNQGSVR